MRGSIFSAYVVSWVAVALLWVLLLDPDRGVVAARARACSTSRASASSPIRAPRSDARCGHCLENHGLRDDRLSGGPARVPKSLHEAAALDGAGALARFRYVTWPLLRPTAAFVATTSLIVSFQAFDVVRIMTGGGPARATTLFVYAVYEQIFMNLSVGRASALAVVFFLVLCAARGAPAPSMALADGAGDRVSARV